MGTWVFSSHFEQEINVTHLFILSDRLTQFVQHDAATQENGIVLFHL